MEHALPVHTFSDHDQYVSSDKPIVQELRPAFAMASYATDKVHRHDYYEIYVIENGVGSCQIDGRLMALGAASVCVLPPGVVHAWAERDRIDGFVLRAPLGSIDCSLAKSSHPEKQLIPRFEAWCTELSPKQTDRLISLIEWIADEDEHDDHLDAKRWHLCLETITRISPVPQDDAPAIDIAVAFLRLVERKHHLRWGVQDYANSLKISRATLLRAVQDRFGKSPQVILQERTILEARRLLSMTSLTCAEISDRLGFASQAHFSRAFTRLEGVPPQSMRRKTTRN